MKPKISLITLGVADLERSILFYRDGLGLPMLKQDEAGIAFFDLDGTWLALYPREALAEDAQVQSMHGEGFRDITLAHNEPSKEGVDRVYTQALNAGAQAIKTPQEVFWGGYSGYFADPDGHLWEVAYNPFMDLT